eukprot:gnl/MRDRNA2_/MRDRNA2_59693_c0_seq1.p1 gnl/MRDRNA2_/MRDRNA2_59693_c0~~gnl/MRDRNA2_/MRDRNA2_59693_c0_seq1.p1  ORF type:complete len:963 (+),score=244.66 gnl/MRDRNA2_/MRDRNA2_59693_c0_seq1:419-2890(+)
MAELKQLHEQQVTISKENKRPSNITKRSAQEQYDDAFDSLGGWNAVKACMSTSMMITQAARRRQLRSTEAAWEQDNIYKGLADHYMMRDAALAHDAFADGCVSIARMIREQGIEADAIVAPLKGSVRSGTKVNVKYAGDQCQLSDLTRGTIRLKSVGEGCLEKAYKAMFKLVQSPPPGWDIVGFDDRYLQPLAGGYRDFLFNAKVKGMKCELQINFEVVLLVKDGDGHADYEVVRLNCDLMLHAAQKNDASAVKQHLASGANPNYCNVLLFSSLSYAALHDNSSMANCLLKAKANPFIADSTGRTPVSRAIQMQKVDVAKVIVAHMAELCADMSKPIEVEHQAQVDIIRTWLRLNEFHKTKKDIESDSTECHSKHSVTVIHGIGDLVSSFRSIFLRVSGGMSAAMKLGAKEDLPNLIRLLVADRALVNRPTNEKSLWQPLDFAIKRGSVRAAGVLSEFGAVLQLYHGRNQDKALQEMLKHDLADQFDALCESKPEKSDWELDMTKVLKMAMQQSAAGITQVVLGRGASAANVEPELVGNMVLKAVQTCNKELIILLLAGGASFASCAQASGIAARMGNLFLLKCLAEGNCPLDAAAGDDQMTPMHHAAAAGRTDVVRFLHKEHRCELDRKSNSKIWRLTFGVADFAAFHGHAATLLTLKELGCKLEETTAGSHPSLEEIQVLRSALYGGQTEILRLLIAGMKFPIARLVSTALKLGDVDGIRLLGELKADLTWGGRCDPVKEAKSREQEWAVTLLGELGLQELPNGVLQDDLYKLKNAQDAEWEHSREAEGKELSDGEEGDARMRDSTCTASGTAFSALRRTW